MRTRRKRQSRGFTLIELVLVMLVGCLMLAMVAPSMSRWSRGSQLRDAADQFIAMTRLARTRAVSEGVTYRLNVDAKAGTYQLTMQNGADYVPLQSSHGRIFAVPDGMQMEFAGTNGAAPSQQSIDFYPTGRIQPAQLRITSSSGESITIDCPSPAEGFGIAQAAGGGR